MGITTTFNFNCLNGYQTNNVSSISNQAKLSIIDNPSQLFSQDFSNSSGFTYDSSKAEFSSGVVRQKDEISNATFSNLVNTTPTGNNLEKTSGGDGWGNSSAQSTQQIIDGNGWVQFSPGTLNKATICGLSGVNDSSYSGVQFGIYLGLDNSVGIFESGVLKGTFETYIIGDVFRVEVLGVQVLYKKNGVTFYTSLLSVTYPLMFVAAFYSQGAILNNIQIQAGFVFKSSLVTLPDFTYNDIGSIQSIESCVITDSGTPRYIVNNKYWNGTAWVFSDNSYSQASSSSTFSANISDLSVTGLESLKVKIVFQDSNSLSSVDSISITYIGEKYAASGTIELSSSLYAQALQAFSDDTVTSGNTSIKYAIRINSVLKYWNGTSWVNSNGSLSETNSSADINSNLSTLISDGNVSFKIYALLTSSNSNETPELNSITVTYDFGGVSVKPLTCTIWGYIRDIQLNPISGVIVNISLQKSTNLYLEASGSIIINKNFSTTVTDQNGYFELDLIRSSQYGNTQGYYIISLSKNSAQINVSRLGTTQIQFIVPDEDEKNITDLLIGA